MSPRPPRAVIRYSSKEVLLPYPHSQAVRRSAPSSSRISLPTLVGS